MHDTEQFLKTLFYTAVKAASADRCLPSHLPPQTKAGTTGRVIVIGAGKAAASMAKTVETHWQTPLTGLVITRYAHGVVCRDIEVIEAGHPVPDQAGKAASKRIIELISDLDPEDLVFCLLSGGGSALLTTPAEGISLKEKRAINTALLKSGATISEMNCVRKHLSALKGGRLAALCAPARVLTLMISDVPGDDPSVIASGPTVPDPTTCADALAIIKRYEIELPKPIQEKLAKGELETPKAGDALFANSESHIIATTHDALEAAAKFAQQQGINPLVLGDLEGEAREGAMHHARLAINIQQLGQPIKPPCVILSGGETTVTVRGSGRGGRNAEYLLALAVALEGQNRITAMAADTDGIDGTEDNAGAFLRPDSLDRAVKLGLDAEAMLDNNDGHGFFSVLNDLLITGPTRTNVNDFRAILVLPDN